MRLERALIRLPIGVDTAALRHEVDALDPGVWAPHPEGHPGNSALALVAVDGVDADAVEGPMRPTPHLAELPAVTSILAGLSALGCPIGRTRLMRIDAEADVIPHVDTNRYWWDHIRLHVPVRTDPQVTFVVGDDEAHMGEGEVWAFDTWRRHRVHNPVDAPRVHLVVDTVGGPGLWALVDRATGLASASEPIPVAELGGAVTFESYNQPEVLSPTEVDATLAALLDELFELDELAAVEIDRRLVPFRRGWRAGWARFGPHPAGHATFDALLREAEGALGPGEQPLGNGIAIGDAVRQLVLRPALSRRARAALAGAAGDADGSTRTAGPGSAAASAASASVPAATPVAPAASSARRRTSFDRPVFVVSSPRSGSTMLFEALAKAGGAMTIGSESHQVIESIPALHPASHGWSSNRLTAADATPEAVAALTDAFAARLRDRDGDGPAPGAAVRLIEKTPKNSLRIPFLAEAFPDASFVYLYRDPRETISSMLDAWRSGRFTTYSELPGWDGPPWSLLLTPGWEDLSGRPLAEIVASQWATATDLLLDDLEALPPERWCVTSYPALVGDPDAEMERLCAVLDLEWDRPTGDGSLPLSRHTLEPPSPEKWERNAAELRSVTHLFDETAVRAHAVFADPPPITPVRRRRAEAVAPAKGPVGTTPSDFSSGYTASFGAVLEEVGGSLAATTYQSGRLVLVRRDASEVNTHLRFFPSPMGVARRGSWLALGTKNMVWEFWNQPDAASSLDDDRVDACYMPRRGHVTGDVRIHDLGYDADGELWAVATRFSALVSLERGASFRPRWRPPFVSALTPDDRCHLNGLAMVEGRPRYVTVLGLTDEAGGWRADKASGGALLDIDGGAPVAVGLCMPHSPRFHAGRLWLLESGRGALCTVDPDTGAVETVCELPGFTRGLCFAGNYAFVGLSQVRETVFSGLPITQDESRRECGVWAVDLRTGTIAGFLRFKGTVTELFEVAVLPHRFPEVVEPGASMVDDAFVLPEEHLAELGS